MDYKKLERLINLKGISINDNFFREYLKFQDPGSMLKDLYSTRNRERNNIPVASITSTLTDFNNKINSMSENEIRFE